MVKLLLHLFYVGISSAGFYLSSWWHFSIKNAILKKLCLAVTDVIMISETTYDSHSNLVINLPSFVFVFPVVNGGLKCTYIRTHVRRTKQKFAF